MPTYKSSQKSSQNWQVAKPKYGLQFVIKSTQIHYKLPNLETLQLATVPHIHLAMATKPPHLVLVNLDLPHLAFQLTESMSYSVCIHKALLTAFLVNIFICKIASSGI